MADARFQRDDREGRICWTFQLDSMVILFGSVLDARVQVARQFPWLVVVKEFDKEFSLEKRRKLLREMRER